MSLPHRHSIPLAELRRMIDQHIGTSRWFTIDQTLIDDFARITQDEQFIHVDPVRAAEAPFGSTIAHGFLTMSYLAPMAYDAVPLADGSKLRFRQGPVPDAGAGGRAHPGALHA